jgi:putative transcriptional regulator
MRRQAHDDIHSAAAAQARDLRAGRDAFAAAWLVRGGHLWFVAIIAVIGTAAGAVHLYRLGGTDTDEGARAGSRPDERQQLISLRSRALACTWPRSHRSSGSLRASDADREQAVEALKAAFVQDRPAKAEFEAHLGRALASRTYAELAAVTAGIAAPLSKVQPPSTPSSMAEQRTRRKISQAELATALGISRHTVILIENGRYVPSLTLAFTIARFFDLTVDKMFG